CGYGGPIVQHGAVVEYMLLEVHRRLHTNFLNVCIGALRNTPFNAYHPASMAAHAPVAIPIGQDQPIMPSGNSNTNLANKAATPCAAKAANPPAKAPVRPNSTHIAADN